MSRFFVSKEEIIDGQVFLKDENFNYAINVLRLKIKDKIDVCDGNCLDYLCEIIDIKKNLITAKVLNIFKNEAEPNIQITLFQALAKGEKMDFIIQKCTEIGVVKFVPMYTERTIVKLNGKEDKKIDRYNKIAKEAAKQCKRGKAPKVLPITTFENALNTAKQNDLNIIPYENEKVNNIKTVLKSIKPAKIGIFIGAEGGFSEYEIDKAKKQNISPITLGKRILRTETAGLVCASIFIHELEL